jgi:hypothetical protein
MSNMMFSATNIGTQVDFNREMLSPEMRGLNKFFRQFNGARIGVFPQCTNYRDPGLSHRKLNLFRFKEINISALTPGKL